MAKRNINIENFLNDKRRHLMTKIGLGFIIVMVLLLGLYYIFGPTPTEKACYGLYKLLVNDAASGQISLGYQGNQKTELGALVGDLSLVLDYENRPKRFYGHTRLALQERPLLESVFAVEGDTAYIDLKSLYDKPLYYENALIEQWVNRNIQMRRYLSMINFKGIALREYAASLEDVLGYNITAEGRRIKIVVDENSLLEILSSLSHQLQSDDQALMILHEETLKMLDQMVADDFSYMMLSAGDIKMLREQLQTQAVFERVLKGSMKSLTSFIEKHMATDFEIHIDMHLGMFFDIDGMAIDVLGQSGSWQLEFDDESAYAFGHYRIEDAENFGDIMFSVKRLSRLINEIASHLADRIAEDPALSDYMNHHLPQLDNQVSIFELIDYIQSLLEMLVGYFN